MTTIRKREFALYFAVLLLHTALWCVLLALAALAPLSGLLGLLARLAVVGGALLVIRESGVLFVLLVELYLQTREQPHARASTERAVGSGEREVVIGSVVPAVSTRVPPRGYGRGRDV